MAEKYPLATAIVALTGTTDVELLGPPPTDVSYRVMKIFGRNTSGIARTLTLSIDKAATKTEIWTSPAQDDDAYYNQSSPGAENFTLDIVLADTDESLYMKLDDTGTDRIVVVYEIREA